MIYMPINHGVVHLLTSFIDHITTILYPIASPYFIMFRWLYKYTMLTFVNKGAGLYSMFTPGNKVHVVREMHQNRCGGFLAEKRVAQLIFETRLCFTYRIFSLSFPVFSARNIASCPQEKLPFYECLKKAASGATFAHLDRPQEKHSLQQSETIKQIKTISCFILLVYSFLIFNIYLSIMFLFLIAAKFIKSRGDLNFSVFFCICLMKNR